MRRLSAVRRRVLPDDQLALIRAFAARGKSLIGIRTASHAFAASGNKPAPAGHTSWGAFDAEVLGGNYHGHHKAGAKVDVAVTPSETSHPLLQGVDIATLVGHGPSTKSARSPRPQPRSSSEPSPASQPNRSPGRTPLRVEGVVFYTSLGHVDDFTEAPFQRLLRNAVDLGLWPGPTPKNKN